MQIKSLNRPRRVPSWCVPVTEELLQNITRRIVDECKPEKIILFGSHAYGKPRWDSDVDLLVITRQNSTQSVFQRSRQVYALFSEFAFPMDILVRTPKEVAYRSKMGDNFFNEIIEHGRILYERRTYRRVGAQSRNGLRGRVGPDASSQKSSA